MIEEINEQKKAIDLIFQQAIALHQGGQISEAEQLYRRILQTYPNHSDSQHNLGMIAAQTGHTAASLAHFKSAFDAAPGNERYILSYAFSQLNNGYMLEAMKTIKTARTRGSDSAELKAVQRQIDAAIAHSISNPSPTPQEWDGLVKLYTERNWPVLETRSAKLAEKYAKAAQVWKMLTIALESQGKPALPTKRKAAQLAPDDIDLQFNLANDLQQQGLAEEAENILRAAVANNPDNPVPYANLGIFLTRLNRVLDATVNLRKALELNPEFVQALCALATLLHNAGQTAEAGETLQRAIAIKPVSAQATSVLGLTLFNLGQIEPAALQFNKALEIDPNHVDAIINLGNALKMLGLRDDAEKCYLRALELQPNLALAHNNLGLMMQENRDFDKALLCFQRAITLDPQYINAIMNLGFLYVQREQFGEAAGCFQHCVQALPAFALAYCYLGLALHRLGQLNEALNCLQQAIHFAPEFAFAYSIISAVLVEMGELAKAEEAISRALALDPTDPRILATALTLFPYSATDARFDQLEAVYSQRARYGFDERVSICLAYGKAMEQIGELDKSVAAYQEGNGLRSDAAGFVAAGNDLAG
ncbi:tetratricopeptide (TPR) repeat protein [Oxalobacteraceae bacterium GrIS 2.11]